MNESNDEVVVTSGDDAAPEKAPIEAMSIDPTESAEILKAVEFEESKYDMAERKIISSNRSKMAEMLMRSGLIESERGANFILAGVAVFFFLMSFLIFILGAAKTPSDTYLNAVDSLQEAKVEVKY
jgi:hypothetical protein